MDKKEKLKKNKTNIVIEKSVNLKKDDEEINEFDENELFNWKKKSF
jgi:hypothetical protein